MENHFHLLEETPEANLVAGMKWFMGAYTQSYNRRHGLRGPLFQGRYKTLPVESGQGGYFERVSTYIHLNPAKAGLLGKDAPVLAEYGKGLEDSAERVWDGRIGLEENEKRSDREELAGMGDNETGDGESTLDGKASGYGVGGERGQTPQVCRWKR